MRLVSATDGGSAGAPVSPNRRKLLLSGLAVAAIPTFHIRKASAKSKIKLINRWKTENKTVYPFTLEKNLLYLNGESAIEVLDVSNGEKLWSHRLDSPCVFRPRLADETVISSGRSQIDGWERTGGEHSWGLTGKKELGVPHVYRGRAYFGEGHRLLALNTKNGEKVWSFETDARARIGYAPTSSEGVIYLGAGDGVLYALDSASGELRWKVDREKDWQYLRQITISGDVLIAGGYHDEIFGINKKNGDIIWRFNAGNFINSQLVTEEATYFWSPTGWVYAFATENGLFLWRHRTVDYSNLAKKGNWAPIMAEMVAERNRLYILAMDHVLHILDRESGKKIDQYQMPTPMRPFITLQHGTNRVMLCSENGEVYYMELT